MDRSIRPQLDGICKQSLSTTLTVCSLYAGIIHLVLFHNSVRTATRPTDYCSWHEHASSSAGV